MSNPVKPETEKQHIRTRQNDLNQTQTLLITSVTCINVSDNVTFVSLADLFNKGAQTDTVCDGCI